MGIATTVTAALLMPTGVVLDHVLRENPHESILSLAMDKLKPARVIYDRTLNLGEFGEEVKKFSRGKALTRCVCIPAGDVFSRTHKNSTAFRSEEYLWEFVQQNISPVSEEPFGAKGIYDARLRQVSNGGYWLHVTSPLRHWSAIDCLDIIGQRRAED
jgi:hypothetical protein